MPDSEDSLETDSNTESPVAKKPKLVDTRNFYFENQFAYTKSGADLVNNVYAYNLPEEIQEKDLVEYFNPIGGEVKMLKGTRVAYVHFENPEDAANVLAIDNHTVYGLESSFLVKACDSLLQSYNSKKTLLDLDDNALLYLLKFMPLKDKLALACSHERFITPFRLYAKTYIRQITEDDLHDQGVTAEEVEMFFQYAGPHLQALLLYGDFETTLHPKGFNLVTTYCGHLRYFELQKKPRPLKFETFHTLLSKLKKLQALRLVYLEFDDECFHTLRLLPDLTHLTIIECMNISGRNLHLLPNLRKFSLSSFYELNTSSIKKALAAMPNLYSLSLVIGYYSKDDNDSAFKSALVEVVDNLPSVCKNIEILNLNLPHTNIRGVSELKKLKSLKFRVQQKNMNSDFRALVDAQKDNLITLKIIDVYGKFTSRHYQLITHFKNLKKLHLPGKYEDDEDGHSINDYDLRALSALEHLVEFKIVGRHAITNDGLLQFVGECRKLKWVNIMKTFITNDFAKGLLPLLKKGERPNGRITFLVWGSNMSKTENFPAEFSLKEVKRQVIFVFEDLLTTLKSYDNFDDAFDKDFKLVISSFCCEDS